MGKGNKELSFQITKQKAVYEEVWFIVLMIFLGVVLLTLVTIFFVRRKTKALLKKQHETKLFIREMIEAFAKTIDMKDKYTNGHSTRVAEYTAMLTKELGYDEETVENYYNIALLHDIGKIAIPDNILNKPSRLTDEEYATMKSHTRRGAEILEGFTLIEHIKEGALYHHERYDGRGYPQGLKGEEIPLYGRIIGVADAFDAMTANRIYRNQMDIDYVLDELRKGRGTQFDPRVVDIFLAILEEGTIDLNLLYPRRQQAENTEEKKEEMKEEAGKKEGGAE
jgi:energy-coupling factor transport system substrate-specific component